MWLSVRGNFEHQRLVVPDLLYGRHGRRPLDRTLERDEMFVGASPIVVDVGRHEVARRRG